MSRLNFKSMVERKFVEFEEGDKESSRIMWKEHWKLEEHNPWEALRKMQNESEQMQMHGQMLMDLEWK